MNRTHLFIGVATLYACVGCSSDSSDSNDGSVGGTKNTGGAAGKGGSSAKGGTGSGGSSAAGGTANSGGSNSSGGTTSSGGSNASGGTTSSGGSSTSGGSAGSAGASNAGSGGTSGSAGSGNGNPDILEPAQGALLGQYYGDGSIAQTSARLGRTLKIHLVYHPWTGDWTKGETKADLDAGRIPLVNWEPFGTKLDDIISGKYDDMLSQRAAAAKALNKKFFMDWGAEMNGEWSDWSGTKNGESAAKYISAYRHIHDKLRAGGATNIVWLWCPNVTDEPREAYNQAMNYYPGDEYVDWTCVDGYNWGTSNDMEWQSFKDVFKNIYPKLAAKNKPIMIGEMASSEQGGNKAEWIKTMIPTLKSDYPMIKGVVWFDVLKETSWQINSSPASLEAFKAMAADPYFNP